MIDWNRNGKIDPIDVGISIAMDAQKDIEVIELLGYPFKFIQELEPERNVFGKIKIYDPKNKYYKKGSTSLNKYGVGPFCKFSLNSNKFWGVCGVYALFDRHVLLYVGLTQNFAQRFNQGYGIIAPKNCYVGGQSTNCKINAMILNKYLDGEKVFLFFHETQCYNAVETKLIESLNPPYNNTGKVHTQKEGSYMNKEYSGAGTSTMTNMDMIVQHINQSDNLVFCDDCLSELCNIHPRQQVNQICNRNEGTVFISKYSDCSYCGKHKKVRKLKK